MLPSPDCCYVRGIHSTYEMSGADALDGGDSEQLDFSAFADDGALAPSQSCAVPVRISAPLLGATSCCQVHLALVPPVSA